MALFGDYANSQYVSQFVARPTDLLIDASDKLQAQYDQSRLTTMKMQQLASSIQAIKEQKPLLEGELLKYEQAIAQMAEQGDWENLAPNVEALAMDLNQNMKQGRLAAISQTYQGYQQNIEARKKLEAEGKYGDWNNDYGSYLQRNRQEDGTYNFDREGTIDAYQFSGMSGAQDHLSRATDMMAKIAEDGSMKGLLTFAADGTFKTKKGSEHILKEKVLAIAEGKSLQFLATQEGRDWAKMMQHNNGGQLTTQQLKDGATSYLYQTATNQIFYKSEEDEDFNWMPAWKAEELKLQDAIANATSSHLEGETNQQQQLTTEYDNVKVDKNGNVQVDEYKAVPTNQNTGNTDSPGGFGGEKVKKTPTELKQERADKQKYVDDMAIAYDKANPNNTLTKAEKVKKYKEARKNNVTVNARVLNLTPEAMSERTKLATGMNGGKPNISLLSGRKFVVGGKQIGNINQLMDHLGLDDDNYTITARGISLDDQYGMAGGEVFGVTVNGKAHTIYTSPANEQLDALYTPTRKVMAAVRAGVPQQTVDFPERNMQYVIENNPVETKDGTKFSTVIRVREKQPNGTWQFTRRKNGTLNFSLEEFMQAEQEIMKPTLDRYYNADNNVERSKSAIEQD